MKRNRGRHQPGRLPAVLLLALALGILASVEHGTVSAAPARRTLKVAVTGPGSVTSSPAGIDCPASSCTATFASGTTVQLTAAPAAGAVFDGWSGACTGTGPCTLSMTANRNVNAQFSAATPPPPATYTLTTTITGSGSIVSSPAGIDCPATACAASFASGTSVQLTATPATGYTFDGWSGACTGTAGCTVSMTANATVGVTFVAATTGPPPPYPSLGNTALARLRVASWNVAGGHDAAGVLDEQGQLDLLASLRADIIVLQQVSTADDPNMPQNYIDGMSARTGATWVGHFEPTTSTGTGNLIMTRLPVDYYDSALFDSNPSNPSEADSHRGAVHIQVTVNSVPVQITGTDLAVDAAYRLDQVQRLNAFVTSQPVNRIVGGDFNAEPQDTTTWNAWGSAYLDVWRALSPATDPGFTTAASPATAAPARLDYWFTNGTRVTATEFFVVQTRDSNHGVVVSDVQVK